MNSATPTLPASRSSSSSSNRKTRRSSASIASSTESGDEMTEHEDRVEQLIRNDPPIQRSVWQRLGRLVARVAMVCSFLGLAAGAYGGLRAQQIAHCTNTNLDARGVVQIKEAAATRVFAQAIKSWANTLNTALTVTKGSAEQKQMVDLFQSQTAILADAVGHWNR